MPKLIEQIASLQTVFSPGIFARYTSSRPDILAALTIGPEGTPYENSWFQFDILCPANYTRKPPKVWLRTTGGGRAGFGPNLYADGKVCLSLLGTWPGQAWIPNQSTLLQVLVSIQSMVLFYDPMECEPGLQGRGSKLLTSCFNTPIQVATILEAILRPLSHCRNPGLTAVGDVITLHFHINVPKISAKVRQWQTGAAQLAQKASGANYIRISEATAGHKLRQMPAAIKRFNMSLSEFLNTARQEVEQLKMQAAVKN
jgi:ubiquitin-protein ligase